MRHSRNKIMQTLFNTKLPFLQVLRIQLTSVRPGLFRMTAYNKNQLILPPASWVPKLFFNFEQTFYGMTTSVEERDLLISAADLLDLFSPATRHPFLDFESVDDETAKHFTTLQTVLPLWTSSSLWQHAQIEEQHFIFQDELLQQAVEQKLANAGLSKEDALTLIPYFLNGGWPMQRTHTFSGVKVALRLSEPEENEDNWLLETILISPNSSSCFIHF